MILGNVDKSEAATKYKILLFTYLRCFNVMSKKNVFSVVASLRKMAFFEVNNDTNVMFVVVNFQQRLRNNQNAKIN